MLDCDIVHTQIWQLDGVANSFYDFVVFLLTLARSLRIRSEEQNRGITSILLRNGMYWTHFFATIYTIHDQVPCTWRALVTILMRQISDIDVSPFFQGNVCGQRRQHNRTIGELSGCIVPVPIECMRFRWKQWVIVDYPTLNGTWTPS